MKKTNQRRHLSLCAAMIITTQICRPAAFNLAALENTSVSALTYDKLLDIVFPRPELDPRIDRLIVVLRFQPSFELESQICIIQKKNNTFEVTRYSPRTQSSIWEDLPSLRARAGAEDAERMAKFLIIDKTKVVVGSAQLRQLLDDYSKLDRKIPSDHGVVVDGATYNLWLQTTIATEHLTIVGSLSGAQPEDLPTVRWMAHVRSLVIGNVARRRSSD